MYLTLDDALYSLGIIEDQLRDALASNDTKLAQAKCEDLRQLIADMSDPGFNQG